MHGVDYVALSFVRRPEDILDARQYIQQVQAELGQGSDQAPLPLIAKLEKPATPDAPPLKRPYNWRVHDDDQGMQMRWIGLTLVIDRELLMSRHFPRSWPTSWPMSTVLTCSPGACMRSYRHFAGVSLRCSVCPWPVARSSSARCG